MSSQQQQNQTQRGSHKSERKSAQQQLMYVRKDGQEDPNNNSSENTQNIVNTHNLEQNNDLNKLTTNTIPLHNIASETSTPKNYNNQGPVPHQSQNQPQRRPQYVRNQKQNKTTYVPRQNLEKSQNISQASANSSSTQSQNILSQQQYSQQQNIHQSLTFQQSGQSSKYINEGTSKQNFTKKFNQDKQSENNTPNNRYKNNNNNNNNTNQDGVKNTYERHSHNPYKNNNKNKNNTNINQSQNGNNYRQNTQNTNQFEESPQKNNRNRFENQQNGARNTRRNQSEARTQINSLKPIVYVEKQKETEEERKQNHQIEVQQFKQSSENFQKQLEDKMTEFMHFHNPKTILKKENEKNLSREQRKINKIIRESRKNHSIIKSPAGNQLVTTNWDGLDEIEQSYEFLERKSVQNDQSLSSAFGNGVDNSQQMQNFPSLLNDSRLSKFAPSSVKPSRKNSVQNSEVCKDEFKETIEQIRQEIEQEEKMRKNQQSKQSNDLESLMESHEVIQEHQELEDEEADANNKKQKQIAQPNGHQKKQGQKQKQSTQPRGSSKREEYVRKDQLEKFQESSNQNEQSQSEQKEKEEEEIEINMDLEMEPSSTKVARIVQNREEKDLQSAFVKQNEVYIQKDDINNSTQKNESHLKDDDEEEEIIPRISNLEDFVPYQLTAQEKEQFEREHFVDQQENHQIQENSEQEHNEPSEYQNILSSSNSVDEIQQKQKEEEILCKTSSQSLSKNIVEQNIDSSALKQDNELVNINQESPQQNRDYYQMKAFENNEQEIQVAQQQSKEEKHNNKTNEEVVLENDKQQLVVSQEIDQTISTVINVEEYIKEQTVQVEENSGAKTLDSQQKQQITPQPTENEKQTVQAVKTIELKQASTVEQNEEDEEMNHIQVEGEEIYDELIISQQSDRQRNKPERDVQSVNNNQLDQQVINETKQTVQEEEEKQHKSPSQKSSHQDKGDKIINELEKQCEFFNVNSNHSSEKQNLTQTQDDTQSAKHIEMNGFLLDVQSDKNLDDLNQDIVSEFSKSDATFSARRETKFLQQFSENLKDIGKSNANIINSLGSNIATTFAGYVCNKIVTSSLLKNGKLNQSINSGILFSSFSSYNSLVKN